MRQAKKWLLAGVFALAVLLTFYYLWSNGAEEEVTYEIVSVQAGDELSEKLTLTGKIVPRDQVEIKPQIAGIISELLVEPGAEVQSGDIIARISVVPEMMQVSNAEAQLSELRIMHERLRSVHERNQALYDAEILSKEELERSEAELKQARVRLDAAVESLELIRKGVSARSSKESSTLVRSTIAGKILSIPVKVGTSVIQANTFNPGTTIAVVANMSDLIFEGNADEMEIGKLQMGQRMSITVSALPQDRLSAVVDYISPQGETVGSITRFLIKGGIQGLDQALSTKIRSGYSANAEILIREAKNVLSLPEGCITYRNDSTYVHYVLQEDPLQTEERPVELGLSTGAKVEVRSGLKQGDKVRGNVVYNN